MIPTAALMAEAAKKKKLGPGRHLSAIKRNRQSEKRRVQNKSARSELRTAIKNVQTAVQKGDKKLVQTVFISTQSLLDRAVKRGLLKASTASRHISRLNKRVASL
jgi:small subunit ribosomal protein S20